MIKAPTPISPTLRVGRWFVALSLLCTVVSAVVTAVTLSRFLTQRMLLRDAEVSAEFIESIVRAEGSWSSFEAPNSVAARTALDSFFTHVSRLPGVVRANIYLPDGSIVWSSNASIIGHHFGNDNAELARALRGEITVETGTVVDRQKEEYVALAAEAGVARFIEAYLPIRDEAGRRVIGVVEIYRLPQALFAAIDDGVRLVWLCAAGGAALLYAALTWLVCRARWELHTQNERLREAEALAAVGAVATAVAHGIRNPLASIRSSAELAGLEEEPARVREALQAIEAETDRVEVWVRDLLLTARGEPLARVAVNVSRLLEEIARRFAAPATRQAVHVQVQTTPTPSILGNVAPLTQALENLVTNSLDAMPGGGNLELSAAPSQDGGAVVICICDTGSGVPEALSRERLPLFFSTKPQGTGLGLALTRRIVGRHGGTLHLERRRGGGTRATIRLPASA